MTSTDGAILEHLFAGQAVPAPLVEAFVEGLLANQIEPLRAAAVLAAWRCKGETADELAAAATVLRRAMRILPGASDSLDTCGTGGDGSGTFNISTATALVVAACGVPVVKHGNRAASGRSGSSDVLAELGVAIERGPDWAARCFAEVGIAFCFAPHFHPHLAPLAPLRRTLGFRTIFNLLGPLANPAHSHYQLLGVGTASALDAVAGAIARLGTRRAVVVHGQDGLDEVSLSAPTSVRIVEAGTVRALEWSAATFSLAGCSRAELLADGPAHSAAIIRRILSGQDRDSAAARVVLANAAAALFAAQRVQHPLEAVTMARNAIESGQAAHRLDRLRAIE
jgi:anthranilate phosphoribosyltransferase